MEYFIHKCRNIFCSVRGDCIQCPFHNWKFCGDSGRCVEVPYSRSSIPSQARLVTRPCVEVNGLVMVWHHADGDLPSWHPPAIGQVESGQWVYQGRNEFYVNCHIQVSKLMNIYYYFEITKVVKNRN